MKGISRSLEMINAVYMKWIFGYSFRIVCVDEKDGTSSQGLIAL
jgi:hypothetical protein